MAGVCTTYWPVAGGVHKANIPRNMASLLDHHSLQPTTLSRCDLCRMSHRVGSSTSYVDTIVCVASDDGVGTRAVLYVKRSP